MCETKYSVGKEFTDSQMKQKHFVGLECTKFSSQIHKKKKKYSTINVQIGFTELEILVERTGLRHPEDLDQTVLRSVV